MELRIIIGMSIVILLLVGHLIYFIVKANSYKYEMKLVKRKLSEVESRENNKIFDIDYLKWECENVHLRGDCPNCGAT